MTSTYFEVLHKVLEMAKNAGSLEAKDRFLEVLYDMVDKCELYYSAELSRWMLDKGHP